MFSRVRTSLGPPYSRAHPIALYLMLGLAVAGLGQVLAAIFPGVFPATSNQTDLPEWLRLLFSIMYFLGGAISFFGLWSGRLRYEAAGELILAFVLAAWVIIWIRVVGILSLPSIAFVVAIAVGCFLRARLVIRAAGDDKSEGETLIL